MLSETSIIPLYCNPFLFLPQYMIKKYTASLSSLPTFAQNLKSL